MCCSSGQAWEHLAPVSVCVCAIVVFECTAWVHRPGELWEIRGRNKESIECKCLVHVSAFCKNEGKVQCFREMSSCVSSLRVIVAEKIEIKIMCLLVNLRELVVAGVCCVCCGSHYLPLVLQYESGIDHPLRILVCEWTSNFFPFYNLSFFVECKRFSKVCPSVSQRPWTTLSQNRSSNPPRNIGTYYALINVSVMEPCITVCGLWLFSSKSRPHALIVEQWDALVGNVEGNKTKNSLPDKCRFQVQRSK